MKRKTLPPADPQPAGPTGEPGEFVVVVLTESGVSAYGDWWGRPMTEDEAVTARAYWDGVIGVTSSHVVHVRQHPGRQNDGS